MATDTRAEGALEQVDQVLRTWLSASLGLPGELSVEVVVGGRSNVTWVVSIDASPRLVLRHPPLGNHVDGGHDVVREARLVEALRDTRVPVPRVVAIVEEASPIGVPLVVMEYVDGIVLRDSGDALARLDPQSRRPVAERLIDTLVDVHAVSSELVPLRSSGRGIAERQLTRWLEQSRREGCAQLEDLERAHDLLVRLAPAATVTALVHGDFRLENCMLDAAGGIAAVLDWELATLGDPLADVGLLLAYWAEPGETVRALHDPPTLCEGFPTRAELAQRYLASTGRSADDLAFYEALGWWKVACIVGGVHARIQRRVFNPPDRTEASFRQQAAGLAAEALRRAGALAPRPV